MLPPCPRCGSARVVPRSLWGMAGAALLGAFVLVWIPLLGWIAAPFALLIAIVLAVWALSETSRGVQRLRCRECRKEWTVPREQLRARERTY